MDSKRQRSVILGLVLMGLGIFLAASILSHDSHEGPFADSPRNREMANICGVAGAYAAGFAIGVLGWVSLPLAGAIAFVGLLVVRGKKPQGWITRSAGIAVALLAMMITLGFLGIDRGAGAIGHLLTRFLLGQIGWAGILTMLLLICALSVLLLAGPPGTTLFTSAGDYLWRGLTRLFGGRWEARQKAPAGPESLSPTEALEEGPYQEATPPAGELPVEAELGTEPAAREMPAPVGEAAGEGGEARREPPVEEPPAAPEVITRETRAAEAAARPAAPAWQTDAELAVAESTFQLPPLDLLDRLESQGLEEDENEIRQKGVILERTLSEFKIEARVVRVQRGPVITMYELSLAAGTKVSRVESLSNDLAIALKAPNVRIVAPLPGKNTVGIELPNTLREIVGLRELLEQADKKVARMAMPLFLGKDTAGNPLIMDLALAPHLLLAGATGSGKSVAINTIICSILMTRTPREVQFLLVDPKSVEFPDYQNLPHLICPILADMKKAAAVLQWACKKMDERYAILSAVGVRNIESYNKLGREEIVRRLNPEEDAQIDDVPFYMPHIVIVIDELGELMMVAAKEVESSIIRLSQKARSVGIHLICATQRPSVDVVTGLIKANLPARLAFQVASKVDSRTILDRNGAELLLGRGDMLVMPPGSGRLVRAQGAYLSTEEIHRIMDFLTDQAPPHFRAELRDYHATAANWQESDELYDEAVRIVLETQRGSVSLLQRRLSIGYSRAARLVDMMAEAGIVGAYKGSQAREVLMSLEEWEQARQKVQ